MASGYLNLVLHAHLPYIKHPRQRNHIEQRWFYEAVSDCYIPFVETLDRLDKDGKRCHLTLSLSPTLCVMLNDDDLKDGCEDYLNNLIEFSEYECKRNTDRPEIAYLGKLYLDLYRERLRLYREKYDRDLISAFKLLSERGRLTLITTSATHAYLPLLEDFPRALSAQIKGGLEIFNRITGIESAGFWLPECGYTPGIEKIMSNAGIGFAILESHGIIFASPYPSAGLHSPVLGPYGVAAFGRDAEVSQLVWSAQSGYPADTFYRDFYDDAVFELSENEVRRFVHHDGIRAPSGIKYKRVTGRSNKDIYDPEKAAGKLIIHSSHFIEHLSGMISEASGHSDFKPVVTIAFDAELFGHWWYEGCGWLERVLSGLSRDQKVEMTSGSKIIESSREIERVIPESSSWGNKGYSETWINPRNDWMFRNIYRATDSFIKLAGDYKNTNNKYVTDALNMAARELLMLQASDWGFMMNNDISISYIEGRFMSHFKRVTDIIEMVNNGEIRQEYLSEIERKDGEFIEVDYRWFCGN